MGKGCHFHSIHCLKNEFLKEDEGKFFHLLLIYTIHSGIPVIAANTGNEKHVSAVLRISKIGYDQVPPPR